jgi:hypothetical protein
MVVKARMEACRLDDIGIGSGPERKIRSWRPGRGSRGSPCDADVRSS